MSEQGWYPPGVTPTPGERYEFEDFVGARFTATFTHYEDGDLGDGDGRGVWLHFEDRESFGTNLPIRFRDANETPMLDSYCRQAALAHQRITIPPAIPPVSPEGSA